jgi:hypothetical protein
MTNTDTIADEQEEREAWERDSKAANAYAEITSACFRENDDYNTDAGMAHIVAKHVVMAIGGECC